MTFDIEAFHQEAVSTPSHENVTAMRELVVDTLMEAGLAPSVDDAGTILASREPATVDSDYHLLLNTHIDTVPPHVPYKRRESIPGADDETAAIVSGRGACDAKGPLASILGAFIQAEPAMSVTLAITPDEETAQTGAAHVAKTHTFDGAIVGEPTGLDVCTGARGQFEGWVTVEGVAAHAAQPEAGVNAILESVPVLEAISTYDERRGPGDHPTLGSPLLTPTRIEGGSAMNQIPAQCSIGFDRRSVPPESAAGFAADLADYLAGVDSVGVTVSLADREAPHLEAFSVPVDEPLVEHIAGHAPGTVRPFGAATEASLFASVAPTVVFGPGELADDHGPVAHADREYVRIAELSRAAAVLTSVLETPVE